MRDAALLGARLLLGGYMGIHASQKLWGRFNGQGLEATSSGVELPVLYLTLALTLAAAGPGKYKIGPGLPDRLAAVGFAAGGLAAGPLIAKMVTSRPAPAEVAAEPPAAHV